MRALDAKNGLVVKALLFIATVILAAVSVYFGFVKKTTDQSKSVTSTSASKLSSSLGASKPAPASLVEKTDAAPTKTALAKSDYATYQNLQRTLALQYLYSLDTANAERIMNDVIKNVPASKVTSSSYLTMVSIQQKKNDTAEQKKYLQLAIDKLNTEDNPQQAAAEQQVLDGLK